MKLIKTLFISLFILLNSAHADDPSDTFDIMYVYTSAAKQRAGGESNVKLLIQQSINRINQSFINSNMNTRVNLVHVEEIYYPLDIWEWKGDEIMQQRFRTTLQHLIGKNDGYMDNVHTLRDKYSADMVQLMISNAAWGGLSRTMFSNSHYYESNAFTVIGEKFFLGSSVHELGHIMGNQHDIYATPSDGTYSYSHGYGSPSNNFRTIMSYAKACNGTQNTQCENSGINYWSSPIQYYHGEILGASYADARQTILNNAHTIANFRRRPVTTAPILTDNTSLITTNNSISIRIQGSYEYEVYINGVRNGAINQQETYGSAIGYTDITLPLVAGYNNFSITLKHAPSGTVSEALNIRIIKIADSDNDGIYDHIESDLGLNPHSADSDNDGYTDLEEVGASTNASSINNPSDTDGDGIIDALDEDSNNDGISDKNERFAITMIPIYYLFLN